MISNLNIELKKILLRRRNKVILNTDDNIYDIFKNDLISSISESESFKNHFTIESCDLLTVKINVDGNCLEFSNGKLKFINNIDIEKEKGKEKSINLDINIYELCNIVKEETNKIKKSMVYAFSLNENINSLGYSMDEKMFNIVSTLPINDINNLSKELIPILKELIGANVSYNPLYPDFPSQVMNMKNIDLYLNALLHYWSSGTYIPYDQNSKDKRVTSSIEVQYKMITVGKEEDLHNIMTNLMGASEALSYQGIKDLETYFMKYEHFIDAVPDTIPNKENLAVITNLILTHCKEPPINKIGKLFSTVTDVLRLAAVMSGQDATLCKVRFKSFSNKERRLIMSLLNNCSNRVDDFYKHHNLWSRVCERIHPSKFKHIYPDLVMDLGGGYLIKKEIKKYKKQYQSYDTIWEIYENSKNNMVRIKKMASFNYTKIQNAFQEVNKSHPSPELKKAINKIKELYETEKKIKFSSSEVPFISTTVNKSLFEEKKQELKIKISENTMKLTQVKKRYASRVEDLLSHENFDEALKLLSQRPGIFTKRLDELLLRVNDPDQVLKIFEEIAPKVSVKVLLSLKGYFQKRSERLKLRVFLIKGTTPKMYFKTKVKEELDSDLCEKICHICDMALISQFENKEKMNKVFISEDLKKYVIPLDLRSSNSALETYSKGSRFSLSYKQLTKEEQRMMIQDKEDKITKLESGLNEMNKKLIQLKKEKINNNNNDNNNNNKKKKKKNRKNKNLGIKTNQIELISDTDNEKDEQINSEEIKNLENEISIQQNKIINLKNEIKKDKINMNRRKGKNVRLFIWWTNTKKTRVDIDLSVMIYDQNLVSVGHVSYTRLRDFKYHIYHSGDITNGGDVNGSGAAEFIDFNPEQIIRAGARYIAVSVISFSGINFNEMENCKFGWMERDNLRTNELFEPKTVRQKMDMNSKSTSTVPVVFDCQTREMIWVDTVLTENQCNIRIEDFGNFNSNVSNNASHNSKNNETTITTTTAITNTNTNTTSTTSSTTTTTITTNTNTNEDEDDDDDEDGWTMVISRRERRQLNRWVRLEKRRARTKNTVMNGLLYYYLNPLKDNMYNLAKLHVQARDGQLVDSEKELSKGDIAFVSYLPYKCIDGVTYIRPTDLDIILSEYMTSSSE